VNNAAQQAAAQQCATYQSIFHQSVFHGISPKLLTTGIGVVQTVMDAPIDEAPVNSSSLSRSVNATNAKAEPACGTSGEARKKQ
jgi:hypothetical protein